MSLSEGRHDVKKQQEAKREECFFTSCLGAYHEVSLIDIYRRIKNIVLQKAQNHVFVLFEFILVRMSIGHHSVLNLKIGFPMENSMKPSRLEYFPSRSLSAFIKKRFLQLKKQIW